MPSNFPPEMLRQVPLFTNLTDDEIEEILAVAEDREYKPDETVIQAGRLDRALYVIFDGQVQVVLPTPSFQETVVATLEAGTVFGESTFFHSSPHVASVRCMTPVLAVRLSREQFDQLMHKRSLGAYKVAANVAEILAQRLQDTDRWIEDLIQQEQDAQIAASWRSFRSRAGFSFEPQRWGP